MAKSTRRGRRPDISPVLAQDPEDLRFSISSIIHWADSREVRLDVMARIKFPVDDIPMFLVVNQLSYRGALRPTDLASTLGTGKANVSKIVQRLEAIGLVTRVPSPSDERSVLVALTARGRTFGRKIMDVFQENLEEGIAGWDESEVQALRRVMARYAAPAVAEVSRRSPALQDRTELRP